MMDDYIPTAEDFAEWDSQYKPSASDFAEWDKEQPTTMAKESPKKTMDTEKGVRGLMRDAMSMLSGALTGGINFASELPDQSEKSLEQIQSNPARAGLNVLSGAGSLARDFYNTPYDVSQYFNKKEILAPKGESKFKKALQVASELLLPHIQEDLGFEKAVGLDKEQPGDKLLKILPSALTIAGSAKSLVKSVAKPDMVRLTKNIQKQVNTADRQAGATFDRISEELKNTGQDKVPILDSIIDNAKRYFPKHDEDIKALFEKARSGDYDALRTVQADLRTSGNESLKSDLNAERNKGRNMNALSKSINNEIIEHLKSIDRLDLAKDLTNARNTYRDLQETYFSTPELARVFGESQKVPKNPATLFTTDSTEVNRLKALHPEINKALAQALRNKKSKSVGKKAFKGAVGLIGAKKINKISNESD